MKQKKKFSKGLILIIAALLILTISVFFSKNAFAELPSIWTMAFRELPFIATPAKCPSDMVWVDAGKFCIDKYEASQDTEAGNVFMVDINGDGDFEGTVDVYGDGTTFDETTPTYRAKSEYGAKPWVNINQVNAKAACMAAGKHLATNYEMLLAAKGMPDPDTSDPADDSEPCNIWYSDNDVADDLPSGAVEAGCAYAGDPDQSCHQTGTATLCVSDAGAYDLIGNVWEWTDNVINGGLHPVTGIALPAQNRITGLDVYGIPNSTGSATLDYNYDYFWINADGYRGFIRGGGWAYGSNAGLFTLALSFAPSLTSGSIGFRCAR